MMAIYLSDPNDVLAQDADLDLAWPEPKREIGESIGSGKLWRFTFDDGVVISATPMKGARTFRLFSSQVQATPFVHTNRSAISSLVPDEEIEGMSSERCGWVDIYKIKGKSEWQIVVRVQSGPAQSFLYPTRVVIPTEISVVNQVMSGPTVFHSREDAIRTGAGVYYAATRKLAGEIWFDNHKPIIEIQRL